MNEATKQSVDSNSAEFNEGVEDGMNSTKNTQNWNAGNELGQELKAEAEDEKPAFSSASEESGTPLFASRPDGNNQGNDQDEKDETEE